MRKVIVSDTSCIGYLIQINLLNLLQIIYGEIIIPDPVNKEVFDITGLVAILITAKNKNLILSVKDALDKVILLGCRISEKLYNIALKSCNEL